MSSRRDVRAAGSLEQPPAGSPSRGVCEERRQGFGVQDFLEGSKYEGEFVDGLKQGKGRYTWRSGEFYEGSFYKDYRHGDGMYCWPTGKFIGKFYLNWREGYGKHIFPDGAIFKGLYHADQRFGPGVLSEPTGCQDVGLWHGKHLIQMCNSVQGSFSLTKFTEYAVYLEQTTASHSQSQTPKTVLSDGLARTHSDMDDGLLLFDENTILPSGIENYSTDGDHLPLPPHVRKEFDQHFGQLWEPDSHPYEGYKRDPLSTLPLTDKMLAHIHKHRQQAEKLDWDIAKVLSYKRDNFGPKGPLEVASELLIHRASIGERQAVLKILLDGLVHPDVADSQGHTALIAATINCHNDVIQLLLDMGASIDRLNFEGMSSLSVCHVLYYPIQCLYTFSGPPAKTQDITEEPTDEELTLADDHNRCNQKKVLLSEGAIQDSEMAPAQSFSSSCSMYSYNIEVSEEILQGAAEALSRTGFPQHSDTQETVRKIAAKKFMHRFRLSTLNLLLDRGADPNICKVPLPVLFVAIMAGDTETVRRLLLSGAHTCISLSLERKALYPLHVAAELPGPESPKIIELLLHALSDPDARARDQNEIYELDKVSMIIRKSCRIRWKQSPEEGGRTALHMVCQRETDHCNASKAVSLLLSHRARTDLLWSGHSPLSLAISSGNEMAVEELLKGGADPNIPLGFGVGNALCALSNFSYNLDGKRVKLLDMLEKAGADMLMPVQVGDIKGTAVDYAHFSFNQDLRIANTPFHTLNMEERETFKARRHLLSLMGDLLRYKAVKREKDHLEREKRLLQNSEVASSSDNKPPVARKPFKFCYHCGRSAAVTLTACTRCHKVLYCSTHCKLKAWNKGHKEECVRECQE
ncbi:ankyrin repeat and MYND domain-containing protein 1-like isoform X1 [Phyllopteryx taeniolatus]|uniref:ankyrin repeat and MYND domain-containing protein 1-like isoform X1 n=1 Tax=Phyllopteryx taeniolatus TaxID=161469 RepID=UPI002AD2CA2C|nr:ankyrin repeat and MYND domain-containing protein 1-like isoform X1 [Phyllopteryx taeniolatus]